MDDMDYSGNHNAIFGLMCVEWDFCMESRAGGFLVFIKANVAGITTVSIDMGSSFSLFVWIHSMYFAAVSNGIGG